ncbi:MAG: membrane lipoprotein lipid attachment site-containing protein [Acetobacteraceae bacterium]|nr:membrane lipoprotein lipid attachment site-containing protein [Acetobacteraceae bacterium]
MLRMILLAVAAVTLAGCIVAPDRDWRRGDGHGYRPDYRHDWR